MKTQLQHIAINVQDFDWYSHFFQDIFEMTVEKEQGEKPTRKLWFFQGIQLNECTTAPTANEIYDHIGFVTDNVSALKTKALHAGCKPLHNKENWFILPNGVIIELK